MRWPLKFVTKWNDLWKVILQLDLKRRKLIQSQNFNACIIIISIIIIIITTTTTFHHPIKIQTWNAPHPHPKP